MTSTDAPPNGTGPGDPPLVRFGATVLRRWKTVLAMCLGAMTVALAFTFFRTEVYTTSTTLLMQQEGDSRVDALAARLPSGFAGMAGGGGGRSQTRLITAILSSRTLADSMRERVGTAKKREVFADLDRANTVVITISDSDPAQAARMANAYAEAINGISARITTESTQRRQEFLAAQVALARQRLEEAEARAVEYQAASDAPEIQEQLRLSLSAAADLQREITAREVELSQLQRTAMPGHPELSRLTGEVAALREQLRRITAGRGSGSFLPGLRQTPELKAATARLLREYGEAEAIYTSLAASLAQAQIDVSNQLPVLTVLDPAPVPTSPAGLGRLALVLLAGVLGLLAGMALVLATEALWRARRDPRNASLFAEWEGIRGDGERGRAPEGIAARD
jgi:tyrosine-protein kinase Etk/Wzc